MLVLRYILLGCLAALTFGRQPSAAHEQAIAITEIVPQAKQAGRTACALNICRIEVAHRFSIHDAESTLLSVLGERPDLAFNREAQMKFEAYVAERFQIFDPERGERIPLNTIGGEVERGFYWVYQEGIAPKSLSALTVTHGVLMDVIPTQTNRVNVRLGKDIRTLVFNRDPGPQSISFDEGDTSYKAP